MARNHSGRQDDGSTEMSRETLDDWTAERLLCGALPPDDAPPGYGGVATLLRSARTEARTATSIRAEDTIAAMVAATRAHAIAVVPRRRGMKAKVATAASAGLLALSGATAAGALPSAAQQQVSTVLAKVGIGVPRGDRGHSQPRSRPHGPTAENGSGGGGTTTNHGDCVSRVTGSGGAQVSSVARSDCGKPSTAGPPPDAHGPVPPSQVKPDDKPTPPPQTSSGGSKGTGSKSGNDTGQGNDHAPGGTPSPTEVANSSANRSASSSPPPHPSVTSTGLGK
jgi:hypothetical protein